MSKFLIQCPKCGAYVTASKSFFAKHKIECSSCGYLIDTKVDRYTVKKCPHCGNTVMYDQAQSDKAICPVCKKRLIPEGSQNAFVTIACPTCSCEIDVDKSATSYACPICKTDIDVQTEIAKIKIREKGLASNIKYEGDNKTLVWKHPIEDFNMGSQLIVHESQEAIFFRDGKALDLFGAGRYSLASQKLPLLNKLYKLPADNNKVFHSEIYFINLVTQTGIKWGTDSKVRLFDPMSGIHVELGACGEFNMQVNNSRKLLLKLVGTTSGLKTSDIINNQFDKSAMTGMFKPLIVSKVKSILARIIKGKQINVLEIDEHLEEIAFVLKDEINKVLDNYGLYLPEFFLTNIITPDDDPNFIKMKEQYAEQYLLVKEERIKKNVAEARRERKVVEAQTKAQEDIIGAQGTSEAYRLQAEAEAKEMKMKGYTYQQETQRNVGTEFAKSLASNGGSGSGILGDVTKLGVGLGTIGSVVDMTKNIVKPIVESTKPEFNDVSNDSGWICPNCGTKDIKSKFCPNCGTKKE